MHKSNHFKGKEVQHDRSFIVNNSYGYCSCHCDWWIVVYEKEEKPQEDKERVGDETFDVSLNMGHVKLGA